MSDTKVFGTTIPAHAKAMLLYAATSACMIIGGACLAIKKEEWDAMFSLNKFGWWLTLIGGVLTTVKAFYSNSSPKPETESK